MNSDTSLDINTNSNPVQTVAQPKDGPVSILWTKKVERLC